MQTRYSRLNAVQAAMIAGASPIIAVDRVEAKLDAARAFGATEAIDGTDLQPRDLSRAVRKLTGGRGADYAFVTVGNADAVSQALLMIRPGGTVVAVGMPPNRATTPLRVAELVWSEQRLLGCRMGATRLRTDVPALVDLYLDGRLKLDELISGRYPLERVNEAIAAMESGAALRNVIELSALGSQAPPTLWIGGEGLTVDGRRLTALRLRPP
jgi:S-(hydroxymethyl)glutathione dehydrogenase / alcohol dehydrogenase